MSLSNMNSLRLAQPRHVLLEKLVDDGLPLKNNLTIDSQYWKLLLEPNIVVIGNTIFFREELY